MDTFNYRALVVDDDPTMRQLVTRFLAMEGFCCHQAHNGRAAREQLRHERYDVVITDLRMPQEHGYELVRQLERTADRPLVVVLTGVREPKLVRHLAHNGVDDVMFKPVELPLFAAKIRGLVEGRVRARSQHVPAAAVATSAEIPSEQPLPATGGIVGEECESIRVSEADELTHDVQQDDQQGEARPCSSPAATPLSPPPVKCSSDNSQALRALLDRTAPPPATRSLGLPLGPSFLGSTVVLLLALTLQIGTRARQSSGHPPRDPLTGLVTRHTDEGILAEVKSSDLPRNLGRLARLQHQRQMTLKSPDMTDDDLAILAGLQHLYGLDISTSGVSDGGLPSLAKLQSLTRLDLHATSITSDGVRSLRHLPNLQSLNLSCTDIDDEVVEVLAELPQVRYVDLSGNRISPRAIDRLRARRPDLTIVGGAPAKVD